MVDKIADTKSVETDTREHREAVALYATAVFLFWFSQYIYVPMFPIFVQNRTTALGAVGLVLSMYGLWQAVIRLPLGMVSDWVGRRKPFILAGLACSGIGAFIMVSSPGVEGLAIGRGVSGLAAGSWVPLVVAFSSLFPPNEAVRATALLAFFNSLGRILAGALAGPLSEWFGYPFTFLVAICVSALAVVVFLPIREGFKPLSDHPSAASVRKIVMRREVMLPSVLAAVGQYVNWAISFGFLIIRVSQLDGDNIAQGICVTTLLLATAVGNLISSSYVAGLGSKPLLYVGFVLLAVGTLWAAFSPTLLWLFAASAFLGLGIGSTGPILMGLSIQGIADGERTTAMGVHQTVYAIGMFTGPALSGVVANIVGIQGMFFVTALTCLVLGVVGTSCVGEYSNKDDGVVVDSSRSMS